MPTALKTEEKRRILDFVANDFKDVATSENWVSHYDKDNDSFALHVPVLSGDTHKRYINDEFAFYLDKDANVKGIFIEYFTTNLISHHEKDLGSLRDSIKQQEKGSDTSVIEFKKKDANKIVSSLEELMLNSMIQRMPAATT
ncbi:MAG: hypothetical protein AAB665_00465 [Patescibacteria group bacterium]